MQGRGVWPWIGGVVVALGVVLSFVPRYLPRASAEPEFVGTWWFVGLPLIVAGLVVVALGLRARRGAAAPPH